MNINAKHVLGISYHLFNQLLIGKLIIMIFHVENECKRIGNIITLITIITTKYK